MTKICPNYSGCRFVKTETVEPDHNRRAALIEAYCLSESTFVKCKRYITRKALWICPDFVHPDSEVSEDEIIERCEKGEK